MNHPRNRGERRAVREQWIARRKFVAKNIWQIGIPPHEGDPEYMQQPGWYKPMQWGIYAKFNLGCGCTMCHAAKYFKNHHKRRMALKTSESQAEFRKRDKVCDF